MAVFWHNAHYATHSLPISQISKQQLLYRWIAEHFLTAEAFEKAFSLGYTELWQLAEYFEMPEGDIEKALTYRTERRGVSISKTEL